jgi:hypothetical protein
VHGFVLFVTVMEALTLLLLSVVTAAVFLLVFCRDQKRARFVQLVEKLPGPFSYPAFGTVLPFLLISRRGEYSPSWSIYTKISASFVHTSL